MATVRVEHAMTLPYPVETVFAAISDIDREPEWQPELLRTWHEPAGPIKLGTKVWRERKIMGRPTTQLGEIVAYEPSTRLEVREQPGTEQSPFQVSYTLTALDDDTTGLEFSIVLEDIPAMAAPLVRRKLGGDVPKQFDRLKELLTTR